MVMLCISLFLWEYIWSQNNMDNYRRFWGLRGRLKMMMSCRAPQSYWSRVARLQHLPCLLAADVLGTSAADGQQHRKHCR